ncbi:MSMEG_0565 family glycosyltransferase [Bradyrhizobium sp. INPA01-394B]|uniref:MSMEG_0565 family glycosyltransferase n=1 Tax=Bradyrhizobium campsiandrae TaxID=1729892 RepID=A0ABR7UA28_9BRAD|nr:MSMEG_0565 family glycosyltransferase [Bradyrhizobium campsiandrae]MBC9878879.1 MSMEG_0565 family glycosyltransferase [Bradyrhizobium campsiandrae]MBC9980860.1 MSMEG_0565 family glycosyltransferase [Bradyrhizobium campsiandrae]
MSGGSSQLRIAILTHSINPRGGVVHALALADALAHLGHRPVVHAPDPAGKGFFRRSVAATRSVPASPVTDNIVAMVETRIADYVRYFDDPAHRQFDVFHAQDGISGNALATLKQRGLIQRYLRTVHHIDAFADERLGEFDRRSIVHADGLFVVSRFWQDQLKTELSRSAVLVGNGVDTARYSAAPASADRVLTARLGLREGPILLSIGGVEQRKNTLGILEAFRQVHAVHRSAQLVIAGGASLLDHGLYRQQFNSRLREAGLPVDTVIETGPLPDADMPSLFRLADVLLFPSLREGFGLTVLEAMASGVPAVVSHIAPFTEYLGSDDVAWCDPHHAGSIADATLSALAEPLRSRLIANGARVARHHDWSRTAMAHMATYLEMREVHYA